jgi:hypothetical protein
VLPVRYELNLYIYIYIYMYIYVMLKKDDRFCGLVVRVPGHTSRIRFPALPVFLSSSGSGTGSPQPREYNCGATRKKSSGSGLEDR